jgi:hypothetical protein
VTWLGYEGGGTYLGVSPYTALLEQTIHGILFVVHLSIFSTYDHFRCRDRRVSASLILVSITDTSPQTFYYSLSVELRRVSFFCVPIDIVLIITCSRILYR